MGVGTMFGFGKKKQQSLPELPPPPSPPAFPSPEGDIPEIRAPEMTEEIPSPEEAPAELPEIPGPEMPEAPVPKPEEMAPMEEFPSEPSEPEELHEVAEVEEVPAQEEIEIPERETVRRPVGPAFVAVDEYRTIMEHSDRVKAKLAESDEFVHRLSEIKADEEKAFDKWRSQLEEIERKLGQIDRVIARAKR